jgi:histidine phosphotransferase ChpT
VAYSAIPRGGSVDVALEAPEFDAVFTLTVKGRMLRVPPKFLQLFEGKLDEAVDAHAIQPYYTLLLAEESGMEISYVVNEDNIVFTAKLIKSEEKDD